MSQTTEKTRGRLKGTLATIAVLGAAAAVVAYFMTTGTEAKRAERQRSARLVEVTSPVAADHPVRIEAWGTVQAARRVTLQPQVGGEIQAIGAGFEPGALVNAGDLLVKIDPADYELAVRQRRSELTRAQAELAQEQGRRAVAEQEFSLVDGEVTEAQRRLMLREPQLAAARAAVASAEAALAEAELALKRTEVRAPFSAVVLEREVNLGTRVSSGSTLASLAGTDAYWVELAVPAASLPWIEIPGAPVRVYHEKVWGKDTYREGRVIRLRGELDDKGRMARLLVEVPDPLSLGGSGPRLLLGDFLRAEVEGRRIDGALAVERGWLRDNDTLWVMTTGNTLSIRPVEVLYRGAEEVYLRDGIEPGERLVVSDLSVPADGMPLRAAGDPAPEGQGRAGEQPARGPRP